MSVTNAVVVRLMACSGNEREISPLWPSIRSSILTGADINFFEKGNTDLCELQQNTWAPLPKPLVVDAGAGETVMPVDVATICKEFETHQDGSREPDVLMGQSIVFGEIKAEILL